MRPSSLGGGRILRRNLSVRLSVCLSVRPVIERHVVPPSELQWHTCTLRHAQRAAYRTAISAAQILVSTEYHLLSGSRAARLLLNWLTELIDIPLPFTFFFSLRISCSSVVQVTCTQWTWVQLPLVPLWVTVTAGRTSGQICSCAPVKVLSW